MAGYYGVIQSVVKRGYNAFQMTFRVHQTAGGASAGTVVADTNGDETLTYRVDVAVDGDKLILFPDRELVQSLNKHEDLSEQKSHDKNCEGNQDLSAIVVQLCQHVERLFFNNVIQSRINRLPLWDDQVKRN
jgi:hypothetical protein